MQKTRFNKFSLGQPAAHVLKDLKEEQRETVRNQLLQKTIHSVFMKEASKTECDQKASFKWLKDGRLQAQTEALIVAAQDQWRSQDLYRVCMQFCGEVQ